MSEAFSCVRSQLHFRHKLLCARLMLSLLCFEGWCQKLHTQKILVLRISRQSPQSTICASGGLLIAICIPCGRVYNTHNMKAAYRGMCCAVRDFPRAARKPALQSFDMFANEVRGTLCVTPSTAEFSCTNRLRQRKDTTSTTRWGHKRSSSLKGGS